MKVAIVGTRKSTAAGTDFAFNLARELAAHGVIIVSGLAYGIDKAAHDGCLAAGGRTIAVLARGVDEIYPAEHFSLAEKIIKEGGAIISEYENTPHDYKPQQFLERNRLISGLSAAIVVIEAPQKSGALNTAAHALDQNKELFVAPGPATHKNYAGSHQLIKEGACLITGAADIFNCFDLKPQQLPLKNISKEQQQVLEAIRDSDNQFTIDKICEMTKLDPQAVNKIISFLIIEGIIKES